MDWKSRTKDEDEHDARWSSNPTQTDFFRRINIQGPSGFPVGFFIGPRARTHAEGRLSGSIKRVPRALPTLPRTLKRTLNRGTYSDTLNRSAYSIRLTQRQSSIENPTLNPEAPYTDMTPMHAECGYVPDLDLLASFPHDPHHENDVSGRSQRPCLPRRQSDFLSMIRRLTV